MTNLNSAPFYSNNELEEGKVYSTNERQFLDFELFVATVFGPLFWAVASQVGIKRTGKYLLAPVLSDGCPLSWGLDAFGRPFVVLRLRHVPSGEVFAEILHHRFTYSSSAWTSGEPSNHRATLFGPRLGELDVQFLKALAAGETVAPMDWVGRGRDVGEGVYEPSSTKVKLDWSQFSPVSPSAGVGRGEK
jgi:hypothetical protein